jgi:hypothetical protein
MDNPAQPTQYTLLELFRLHRTPFLAKHQDSRKLWRILGFGPEGAYVVGWLEGHSSPDLAKLSPKERSWVFVSPVGPTD